MSDPEVPQPDQPGDVDDVVESANAGLAEAEAASADVRGAAPDAGEADAAAADSDAADAVAPLPNTTRLPADEKADERAAAADADFAAFEEAEKSFPGTFPAAPPPVARPVGEAPANDLPTAELAEPAPAPFGGAPISGMGAESAIADAAYATEDIRHADTSIVPSEPVVAPAPFPQPIFVQAPEPPRELGNRGTAGGIGLLAALSFAILYYGSMLGLGALAGDVTAENLGEMALVPLTTWGFWVPVVVFFLGFWLLGAIINRGRWKHWVIFGIFVGFIAYAGHILGQLFEAPFWGLTVTQGVELINSQLLAPLAVAAFVFARELTIWFGAWVARSGARKIELNTEARREYERTLEAGPQLSR